MWPDPCQEPEMHARCRVNIKKIFVDGNEVCVFVDVPLGYSTMLACGWYTVEEEKNSFIKSNI